MLETDLIMLSDIDYIKKYLKELIEIYTENLNKALDRTPMEVEQVKYCLGLKKASETILEELLKKASMKGINRL